MTQRFAFFATLVTSGLFCAASSPLFAQAANLGFLNGDRPILDAHNCYPYDGRWNDRIDRALRMGFPIAIEQDLAWFVDPISGTGRVVLNHSSKTTATDPEERRYFFERVRPIIEQQLAAGDPSKWPIIVLHFDFKDQQAPLLHAVWELLGQYEAWITTTEKTSDPFHIAAWDRKPILVLTEDSDAQEEVFFRALSVGARLRLFGSAHTHSPADASKEQLVHALATLSPEHLLTDRPTTYRRWWNNSWYEVEEGGQSKAGAWTNADDTRLRALVNHAHKMGYWIRFYTLDGFDAAAEKENGWFADYNFGNMPSVAQRWNAAIDAGVDLIATDQYEDLSKLMKAKAHHPSSISSW
jgi:hypothetical protein